VAVLGLAIAIGVLIGQAGSGDSTSSADQQTDELLEAIAKKLAVDAVTTTVPVETSTVEVTTTEPVETTEAEVTTTEGVTTTSEVTTTEAATTTTEAATTIAPTSTKAPPPTEPPPTEPPPTEALPTEAPPTEAPPTEPDTTPTSDAPVDTDIPAVPGGLAGSREELQTTWNSVAKGSDVASISAWAPLDLPGEDASVADLGGNIRLVALTDGESGPVTRVVLVWLPLEDPEQQSEQNAAYRDAFAVLMKTVDDGVTSAQQANVADQLGLSADLPPAADGTEAEVTLEPEHYVLRALDVSGVPGVDTLISVTSAATT
jgi:hypothetical protein